MNASSSSVNLFPGKLQSTLSVSDLRAIDIPNPSRQTPNLYDSSVVNRNSKEGYYFFDVLKPPSLQNQELSKRNSVKRTANAQVDNSGARDINAKLNEEIKLIHQDYQAEIAKYVAEIKDLKMKFSLHAQENDGKYASAERQSHNFESRAKAAEREIEHLKKKVTELQDRNEMCEETVRNVNRKMEKSLRSNRLLLERGSEQDEILSETRKRWEESKNEHEKLARWISTHKSSLEDYEEAMNVCNATSNFPSGISKDFPPGTNVLTHHVKELLNSKKDLQSKVKELSREVNEVRNTYENATQKLLVDIEKKNSQISDLSSKDEISRELISTLKAEIDKHQRENSKISLQCSRLEDEMRSLITKTDNEMSELQSKATSQLRQIREQFESDRLDLRMTVDKITKEKIDLQAEIGQLLRDRRTAVSDMYQRDPRLNKFY